MFDALGHLFQLEIPSAGISVGNALTLANEGHAPAAILLARLGIHYDNQNIQLGLFNPALGHLLLSSLKRECGAVVDLESGILSIPVEVGFCAEAPGYPIELSSPTVNANKRRHPHG